MRASLAIAALLPALAGCAFGDFKRGSGDARTPIELANGDSVESVVRRLGPPDKQFRVGTKDFLTYKSKTGAFVLLFGSTSATDLDLEFHDGKLARQEKVSAGSSYGIFAGPGTVAN